VSLDGKKMSSGLSTQSSPSNAQFKFQKRHQLFISADNETLESPLRTGPN
jgi:hypothetical protein